MIRTYTVAAVSVLASLTVTSATAGVSPRVVGEMRHVMITIENGQIGAHVEGAPDASEMHAFSDDVYSGAASVLNNKHYSSQYGWLAGGFLQLADGESIVIENVSMDAGLEAYEGGMRMMRDMHTYDPLFGTAGSAADSVWAGSMRHDWFAADAPGAYEASFRLYVRDASGSEVASYGEAGITLSFFAVPAPGAAGVFAAAGLLVTRRRPR